MKSTTKQKTKRGRGYEASPDSVVSRTVAQKASLSIGFSRQEYWSGLPLPTPGNIPDPGIEPTSLASPALAGGFFSVSATWEARLSSLLLLSTSVVSDSGQPYRL